MAQVALGAAPVRLSSRPWLLSALLSSKPHPLSPPTSRFSAASRFAALRPQTLPPQDDPKEENSPTKKSRNELKKEARRAVKWGMELANFSPPQIKRVLRVASLEEDVFDAIMLVKRFGPDVREGKRRQFNYIGRLLREAQPDLMEALIQASKDGDNSRLQALSGGESVTKEDKDESDKEDVLYEEQEQEQEQESCQPHIEVAARWFEGLIYKDQLITNEVYSIYHVEFDRQELRKLVRQVQSIQEGVLAEGSAPENDSKLTKAKKPLIRFLRSLAKRSLAEES